MEDKRVNKLTLFKFYKSLGFYTKKEAQVLADQYINSDGANTIPYDKVYA